MLGLLQWLSREKSVESALARVMDTLPKAERDRLRDKIDASFKMYEDEGSIDVGEGAAAALSAPVFSYAKKARNEVMLIGTSKVVFNNLIGTRYAVLEQQDQPFIGQRSSFLFFSFCKE